MRAEKVKGVKLKFTHKGPEGDTGIAILLLYPCR
jgi:hypothetical protein